MNLQLLVADIIALVLDTYSDNVTLNGDEAIVVESRWKRELERDIERCIREALLEAAQSI